MEIKMCSNLPIKHIVGLILLWLDNWKKHKGINQTTLTFFSTLLHKDHLLLYSYY